MSYRPSPNYLFSFSNKGIINAELFLYHVILHCYFCTITWLYIFIPVRSCDFIFVFLYCHVIIYTYSCTITWFFRITYVLSCDFMDIFLYHHEISWTYSCTITCVMVQEYVHEITWWYRNKPMKSRDGTGISPWNHVMVQE
jgi:hypothetical protein